MLCVARGVICLFSGTQFSFLADIPRKGGEERPPVCLYRATTGKKKISTIVTADDATRFHPNYMTVVKSSMSALKKVKKVKKASKSVAS